MIVTEWEQGILDGQIEIRPGLFNCTVAKLSVDYLTHFPLAVRSQNVIAVVWRFQDQRHGSFNDRDQGGFVF
jgi:hypothetical protein